ncbi:MAG: hypothetical protein B6U97_01320 [Candidatus Altiarchaeales archaeon ex4484_96]|nr:MAG: hypothetical protein B6U97_01320 [Candidatus Altiarchaeales archaeon ex4484_96]
MKVDEFMFPNELKYMKGHMWVSLEGKKALLGLTSLGASLSKEIVHIDLPLEDEVFEALEPLASFETIKSVTEVNSPFRCRVLKTNQLLLDKPSLLNKDPYARGWIAQIEALDEIPQDELMNVGEAVKYYKQILSAERDKYKGIYE